jgi:hypothetical protein
MTTTSRWALAGVGGVVFVFAAGILTAGGSVDGLVLLAAGFLGFAGFIVGRVCCVPNRRQVHAAAVPRQRVGSVPTRQGRAPAPGGGRPRRR